MQLNNKFFEEKNYLYLAIFFPITFIIGIAVSEVLSFLLILYYFFNSKNKNKDFKDKKVLFLLIFYLYIVINALIQIDDNLKYSSFFYFRFILLSISIVTKFSLKASSIDFKIISDSFFKLNDKSNIIANDRIIAIGFAMPFPTA